MTVALFDEIHVITVHICMTFVMLFLLTGHINSRQGLQRAW